MAHTTATTDETRERLIRNLVDAVVYVISNEMSGNIVGSDRIFQAAQKLAQHECPQAFPRTWLEK